MAKPDVTVKFEATEELKRELAQLREKLESINLQAMIDLSVAQHFAKLKDEVKQELLHDLNAQTRRSFPRHLETK